VDEQLRRTSKANEKQENEKQENQKQKTKSKNQKHDAETQRKLRGAENGDVMRC
jgi:hypothetical protein